MNKLIGWKRSIRYLYAKDLDISRDRIAVIPYEDEYKICDVCNKLSVIHWDIDNSLYFVVHLCNKH